MRRFNIIVLLTLISISSSASAQEVYSDSLFVDLTVISYNIHHAAGIDGQYSVIRIARTLEQYDADVIALQEVEMGTSRSNGDMQIEIIANHLKMYYVFGRTVDYLGGEKGNAILSRYPIVNSENIDISHPYGSESRALLRASIDLGPSMLRFYATQFGVMPEEQKYQSSKIERIIKGLRPSEAVILCGDLRVKPFNRELKSLMGQLSDVGSRLGGMSGTYPTRLLTTRRDYILTNKKSYPLEYRVAVDTLSIKASDHIPIIAKIRVSQ